MRPVLRFRSQLLSFGAVASAVYQAVCMAELASTSTTLFMPQQVVGEGSVSMMAEGSTARKVEAADTHRSPKVLILDRSSSVSHTRTPSPPKTDDTWPPSPLPVSV